MSENVSRRDLLQIAWAATGMLTLAAGGAVSLRFFEPKVVDGAFGGVFNLGRHRQ